MMEYHSVRHVSEPSPTVFTRQVRTAYQSRWGLANARVQGPERKEAKMSEQLGVMRGQDGQERRVCDECGSGLFTAPGEQQSFNLRSREGQLEWRDASSVSVGSRPDWARAFGLATCEGGHTFDLSRGGVAAGVGGDEATR
jgi:hypothetical protein